MNFYNTKAEKIFNSFNNFFLAVIVILCFLPMLNMLALSLSNSSAVSAGRVTFWPVRPTLASYEFVINNKAFFKSFMISIERVLLGVPVNMLLTVLTAYPLSKSKNQLPGRTIFVWFFYITILFSGGLMPLYFTVMQMGLINSMWALILPHAVPVFNIIILINFFRKIPKEMEEAALIDGASHWRTLFEIYVYLSAPALATLTLFCVVNHWNAWFDGMIYINQMEKMPLQSYLQSIMNFSQLLQNLDKVNDPETMRLLLSISDRTGRSAQIIVAMIPILLIYPYLQKYFVKGIVLGSVKG